MTGLPVSAQGVPPGFRDPQRSKIVAVAISIADEEGLDAVSMRRLAAKLGVGTMSLYRYVEGKMGLLALMDDQVIGEILIPAAEMPRPGGARCARSRDEH
jgi:AcrR family transcriptional regulator